MQDFDELLKGLHELGMVNIKFDNIGDYHDIETINRYKSLQKSGGDLRTFIETCKRTSRDNGRTPFQWDATTHAGFTNGIPWIRVNSNYKTINRTAQEAPPQSVLNYFRQAMQLRHNNPVLVYGRTRYSIRTIRASMPTPANLTAASCWCCLISRTKPPKPTRIWIRAMPNAC
jgi:glycosidase